MTYAGAQRVTFTELFHGTLAMIGRHARAVAIYAVAIAVPGTVIAYFANEGAGNAFETIAGLVAGFLLLEHVLRAEGQMTRGEGQRNVLCYIGAMILVALGMLGGLLLFIVPGLILLARWSIAGGIIVADGAKAIDAMRASWEVTRASQWSIVGFYLVLFLLFAAVGAMIGGVTGLGLALDSGSADVSGGPALLLVTSLVSQAASACGALVIVVLMQRLRPGAEDLVDVFA